MKKMKTENKRKLAGIIAVVLIVSMILSAVLPLFISSVQGATSDEGFSIEADLGFDGKTKINSIAPFVLSITNNSGKDFDGEVEVYVRDSAVSDNSKLNYLIYSEELELINGNSKTVEIVAGINTIQSVIDIKLIDKRGKECFDTKANIKVTENTNPWLGVLSDTPENLTYMSPVYFNVSGEYVVIDKEKLNYGCDVLGVFDYLVINDYNTKELSLEQLNNLREWVSEGGVLLLGIGENSDKVSGGLEGMLSSSNISNAEDGTALQYYIENEKKVYDSITTSRLGAGNIIIHRFDLGMDSEMIGSAVYQSELRNQYLQFKGTDYNDYSYGKNVGFEENLTSYASRLPNFEDKTQNIIFVLIYAYVIIIGPVLYIILKNKDKREKAMFIIPSSAVVLTALIYLLSLNTTYKRPIATVIRYIDMTNGIEEINSVPVGINVVSPDKGTIEVKYNNGIDLKGMTIGEYGYYRYYGNNTDSNGGDKRYVGKIKTGEGLDVELYDMTKWDRTYINTRENFDIQDGFDMQLNIENGGVTGTITNNTGYDMEDIVFGMNNYYQKIDSMENGQTIELGKDIEFRYDDSTITSAHVNMSKTANNTGTYGYNGLLSNGRRYRESLTEREYELELRQDIISQIFEESDSALALTLIGFKGEKSVSDDFKVNNKKVSANVTDVIKAEYKFKYSDFMGKLIPGEIMKPVLDNDMEGYIEDRTVYAYDTGKPLQIRYIAEDGVDINSFTIQGGEMAENQEIYNNITGQWEVLMTDITYGSDVGYLNEYGEILIRYTGLYNNNFELPAVKVILN